MTEDNAVFEKSLQSGAIGINCFSDSLCKMASSLLKGISTEERNAVISPSCLFQAICLLADITAGSTHYEIMDALGGEDEARGLLRAISHMDPPHEGQRCEDFHYSTGASIWMADSVTTNPKFSSMPNRMVLSAVEQVDMGTDATKEKMGQWLSDNTGGIYDESPETDPSSLLIALSAMHLKDAWDSSFDEDEPRQFKPSGKQAHDIEFMRDWEEHAVLRRDGSATVSKALTSGIRLIASMPSEGMSLDDYVQSGAAWRNMQDYATGRCEMEHDAYNLHLPKFCLSSDGVDVTDLVREVGVTEAFLPTADFTPISLDDLMVEKFIQKTRLEIDEEGLEGASYVIMCAVGCAAIFDEPEPKDLYIDRSFAVAVVSPDNIPLFVGTVIDPSKEG